MPITKTGKKKDGLQQYRVRVNYTDNLGKARQVERTAYGMEEAKQIEIALISEYKEKRITARLTVGELYTEYIAYHSHETRRVSHENTKQILRLKVLPYFSDCRLDKLTQPILADWKNKIAAENISLLYKRNAYTQFGAMLNYAVKMGYLVKNPLTVLGTFKATENIQKPDETIRYYTPKQFLSFITVARNTAVTCYDWGFYVFFNIAFYTGARKGEINALKWTDIEGNIMHIRRSVSQRLKGADIESSPKNKSSYRDLQIPDPLMKILEEHKKRQKEASRLFSEDYRICGGEHTLRNTSIDNKNKAFAKAANLPHIRIHDFRHSHASLLANEGINIQEIARRLGHANVQMTWNTYSHLYPREEERAVEILNKIV